jgi:signal transduction histidine kinase/streptogramin lyase
LVNNRWETIPLSPEWPGGATSISADGQGAVWIGSSRGLYCWRDGHFVNWGAPSVIQDKTFHSVLVSRVGDVWLGQQSPSAILRLRGGELKTFSVPPDSRIIRAMTEDAAGNIWAGTSKGTLFRVAGDQVTEETPRRTNDLAAIRCLYATTNGAVWIGYAGHGIGCLQVGHYTEFNQANGLYDNYISEIIADTDGWLWFGGNRGIFKAHAQDFQAVITGQAKQIRSIKYGRNEGLPNLQAPYGDSPNVLLSRDGRLWFPMETALAVVSPAGLNKKMKPPQALLTRVTVDDQMMGQYRGILPDPTPADGVTDLAATQVKLELPPGHRRLEIEFAALSFYAPGNIQFRYRLRGLDENWVEAGLQRSATYSRLPSGHYVFEASACNSDGDWNTSSASFSLVVNPFYWQTWWFRLGLLLAFSAGIIATVRYVSFRRLQQQLRLLQQQAALQKERARIAKDIHDDLGASLTQIAYLGELAHLNRHDSEKVEERIGNMSATARQAVKSLDEIVWAVNPRNDTLAHLIDYINQFAFGYLRLAGIRVRLDFPEIIPQRELSADLRHNIFLTVKEALHNIVKHARATEVRLSANVTELALEIGVEDNGAGFSREPDNAMADGLRNMRQRMSDIGGECQVESQSGSGTKVILHLPWPELNKK